MRLLKLNRSIGAYIVSAALLICANNLSAEVVVLGEANFDSGTIPNGNGWGFGAQEGGTISIAKDTGTNFNGSAGSLRGTYPVTPGGMYVWGGFDVADLNIYDVYIEFWAKMPTVKRGVKFLKIFGQKTNNNAYYANTTFALDYTGVDIGGMYCVGFGDGTTPENDVNNVIFFDGTYPAYVGRSTGKAVISTPQKKMWNASNWGDTWHHFRFRVKFNSGTTAATEVADGAYYVEIDGKVYVDAKNIFNRHYSNKPIQKISLFDWSQGAGAPFELWYDNVRITTGGFYSQNPTPPIQPTLLVK